MTSKGYVSPDDLPKIQQKMRVLWVAELTTYNVGLESQNQRVMSCDVKYLDGTQPGHVVYSSGELQGYSRVTPGLGSVAG